MVNDSTQVQTQKRDYPVALLLCMFLGGLGAHRYYTGYIGLGILQLILCFCGGIGAIWVLIDLIAILMNKYNDSNGQSLANSDSTVSKTLRIIAIILLLLGILGGLLFGFGLAAALTTMPHS